ncbi:MAG: exonuclease/endonuclease/phosphatase family protein [Candidatus Cryosericum sp.]
MRLRVISWNVRGIVENAAQLALLEHLSPDIILLQDVAHSAARTMRDNSPPGTMIDTWNDGEGDSAPRGRTGCLIAVAHAWQLIRRSQPGDPATDNRVLCGTAVCESTALTLVSCYAPTNAGAHQTTRASFFTALTAKLAVAATPFILGMDANGPRVDHPDLASSVWWTPEEATVLGSDAPTSDALRLWYVEHPGDLKRRAQYYPRGPLADSYHRGRKGKYVRSRYDSIRVSPGIHVVDVRYLYDDAIQAGSDHALVVVDLEMCCEG